MTEKIKTVLTEHLGTKSRRLLKITLNSERTLNALSLEMIRGLRGAIEEARNDESVAAAVIEGAGEKAFCAGGDIKQGYFAMEKGDNETAESFFREEYPMDYSLYEFPKPLICFAKGIVMGGGVGVMQGCGFRVVGETTRFAMPEALIGLYPDVGAAHFLNRIHPAFGKFIGHSSAHLNAGDLTGLGLADRFVRDDLLGEVVAALAEVAWGDDPNKNRASVYDLLKDFSARSKNDAPKPRLEERREDILEAVDHPDLKGTARALANFPGEDEFSGNVRANVAASSPTSFAIFEEMMRRCRGASLKEVFQTEFHLSVQCVRKKEFQEGVRALLIDRDRNPQWRYPNVENLPGEWIESFFRPTELTTPAFGA